MAYNSISFSRPTASENLVLKSVSDWTGLDWIILDDVLVTCCANFEGAAKITEPQRTKRRQYAVEKGIQQIENSNVSH